MIRPNEQRNTLRDVAQASGVSIATVSHVLNKTKRVSLEVEQRVSQALSDLNYSRNRSATALRTGSSRTIGLLLPDIVNPFFTELASAATRAARRYGYATLLFDSANSPAQEASGLELMREYGVDGAIWVPSGNTVEAASASFPIINVDRKLDHYPAVVANHSQGGVLVADYVRLLGHERVGLLSGPQSILTARIRRAAFLADTASFRVIWEHEVPYALTLPAATAESLLAGDVTMVVAANDVVAIAAIQHLKNGGFRVPQDISVIGFDDIAWARLVQPNLSTVRQPTDTMGERAVERIIEMSTRMNTGIAEELHDVVIIERDSTAPLVQPGKDTP